ncbi:MAG: hypothetical protein WAM69_08855 [Candidatus Sulfotelmatobacter sp.]
MKRKAKEGSSELCLELKYCERCGGLWMRPVGGGQIYCTVCGREMAELPPASTEPDSARLPRGRQCGEGDSGFENWDEDDGLDSDALGDLV